MRIRLLVQLRELVTVINLVWSASASWLIKLTNEFLRIWLWPAWSSQRTVDLVSDGFIRQCQVNYGFLELRSNWAQCSGKFRRDPKTRLGNGNSYPTWRRNYGVSYWRIKDHWSLLLQQVSECTESRDFVALSVWENKGKCWLHFSGLGIVVR